jgi:hypothetical protein
MVKASGFRCEDYDKEPHSPKNNSNQKIQLKSRYTLIKPN